MITRQTQHGSVLIISLLLLIVMTLLGLSSMNDTIMEEKMAGNLRQSNIALNVGESAMRDAEEYLAGLNKNSLTDSVTSATSGIDIWVKDAPECGTCAGVEPSGYWWADATNWTNDAENYAGLAGLTGAYLIEELQAVPDSINVGQQSDAQSVRNFFQITSTGTGSDGRATVFLRSTYARRF